MTARPRATGTTTATDRRREVRRLVESLGGRYSTELGIDVDAGDQQIERWFLAATLFATRISATIAERTFRTLDQAGLHRIAQARHLPFHDLIELLDRGGYARYDNRTASRLQDLSEVLDERYGGRVAEIARRADSYRQLHGALAALPGWGPTTVGIFLRELRGVWRNAEPPLDDRAVRAAGHLDLLDENGTGGPLAAVAAVARSARLDVRDVESGLVRLTLAHGDDMARCPGGPRCAALQ